jgi:hypothetical protein
MKSAILLELTSDILVKPQREKRCRLCVKYQTPQLRLARQGQARDEIAVFLCEIGIHHHPLRSVPALRPTSLMQRPFARGWTVAFSDLNLGVMNVRQHLAQVAHVDQHTADWAIGPRPGFVT